MLTITTAYVVDWLCAFVFTQAVEVPIYMRLARTSAWQGFVASLITHPILWFVIFPFVPVSFEAKCVLGELWAWLAEAAYLRWLFGAKMPVSRALLWSLIANGASMGLGELCRALTGYP